MTREELINLKKALTIEIREGIYYQAEVDLGQFVGSEKTECLLSTDIKQKSDVAGAINEIDDTLTKIIFNAAKLGVDLSSIKVLINYGLFINTSYLHLKKQFGEGGPVYPLSLKAIMPNYLAIMSSYQVDAYSVHAAGIDLLNTTGKLFIVNYDDLINILAKHDYLEKQVDFNKFFTNKEKLDFQIDFESSQKRVRKN